MDVRDIQQPNVLKQMSMVELQQLAQDIRTFLIENVSKTGGHLSSNLGVVELTIAMHYVFDSPNDKLLFDVGHQAYIHKILTGRAKDFPTLRKYGGLSGFQKRYESEHDVWEAGHASTSLSAALGMAVARDLDKQTYQVIPVIGDGSITNGMAFEALNQIGSEKRNMIIVFNDNDMSISKNVGALQGAFTKLRTSEGYRDIKDDLRNVLSKGNVRKQILKQLKGIKDDFKDRLVRKPIFADFNLDYIGPVDGHNLPNLIRVFESIKYHEGPIIVHVMTKKGKGYAPAELDTTGAWHGVGSFDIETGTMHAKKIKNQKSWSEVVNDHLIRLATNNEDIVCITPAMIGGSKLQGFFQQFPDRSFDCGIAEEHAMTFAAGLAANNKRPFLSIYSSFLQRAYDQANHDVARMDLPVVIGLDRAGLVGEDGDTHHGIFDISILRSLPHVILAEGKDAEETGNLLYTAFNQQHPFFLRYPRGNTSVDEVSTYKQLPIGKWEKLLDDNGKKVVIAYGPDVVELEERLPKNVSLINARFLKPLDTQLLDELVKANKHIVVYETDIHAGGFASSILEYYNETNQDVKLHAFGIKDNYVEHGNVELLRKQEEISIDDVLAYVEKV